MKRCNGRKIRGVILFCFVFCAVCGLPASAVRNNLFILLPISSTIRFPETPVNLMDNHSIVMLPVSAKSPCLLNAETSFSFNNELSYSDIIHDPNKITESYTVNCPTDAGVISGDSHICISMGTTTLSSTVPGGTWTCDKPEIATIHPTTGLVTAQASGTGGVVKITYTIETAGCTPVNTSMDLTVDDIPTIGFISKPADICQGGTSLPLDGIGKIGGGATGGIWSTPAGGTFNPNERTLNATWTPPAIFTGEAVLTLTTTGGTCFVSTNTKINVNTAPSITVQPTAPLAACSGSGTRSMSVTATGTNLTYEWRKNNVALTNDGVVSGQGTTSLTLTNPTTGYAGNYNVVVTGTCSPSVTSAAVPVVVNALPTVTATPLTQTICSGTNINKIVFSGTVAGTTYNWTRDNGINVTGIPNSGVGDISGSLINATAVQQTVKFTITPTVNGCQGSPIETTVVIYPKLSAVISVNGNSSICSGKTAEIWISFTGSGPFKYAINNGTEVTATGNPEKLTVSPGTNTTYTITSLKDNNCVAQASDMTGSAAITVVPLPQLTSPLSASICSGNPFSYTPGVSVAGTTYKWSRAAVPGISNISSEGTGSINEILINTTNAPVNVVYAFELTTPNPQACTNTQNVVVTVNPMPGFT
ncbi:MAG: PKD-like domain-containing protein, partial [Methylococcaceae bacterium]